MRSLYTVIIGMMVLSAALYFPIVMQASVDSTGTPAVPPPKPYVIWGYTFNTTG